MTVFQASLLGLLQGLTEFLPVSSSGHLVMLHHFFGMREPELLFDLVLHMGTLVACLLYFWRDLILLVMDVAVGAIDLVRGVRLRDMLVVRPYCRLALLIAVSLVPTGLAGVLLGDFFERTFSLVRFNGLCLILNGGILYAISFARSERRRALETRWRDAFAVGVAQAVSILPGISRSGATIAAARFAGCEPEFAAQYSFLLSIPTILLAFGYKVLQAASGQVSTHPAPVYAAGFVVSFAVGLASLWLLFGIVRAGKLHWFAPYSVAVGLAALVLA